jgi:hypothetical protein
MKGGALSIPISPLRVSFLDYNGGQEQSQPRGINWKKGLTNGSFRGILLQQGGRLLCRFGVRITGVTCTLRAIRAVPPVPSFYKEKAKEIGGPEQASRPLFHM